MTKNNERVGDCDSHWKFLAWDYCAALLPFRIGTKNVPAGTGYRGTNYAMKVKVGQPEPINEADEAKRKRFLEVLLEVRWLPPKVRRAIMRELGRSQRAENTAVERGRTLALCAIINQRKILMKKKNERPRGGIHDAAVAEVAKEHGLTVAALKGRLRKKRLHR